MNKHPKKQQKNIKNQHSYYVQNSTVHCYQSIFHLQNDTDSADGTCALTTRRNFNDTREQIQITLIYFFDANLAAQNALNSFSVLALAMNG